MTGEWKEHCPYDYEENPAHRLAWRRGWFYRKTPGPARGKMERSTTEGASDSPMLQGYLAADGYLRGNLQFHGQFRVG